MVWDAKVDNPSQAFAGAGYGSPQGVARVMGPALHLQRRKQLRSESTPLFIALSSCSTPPCLADPFLDMGKGLLRQMSILVLLDVPD